MSIVCVFNDAEVRRACLDRSIDEHRDEAQVEYVAVDNVAGSFSSAGAALNHGASLASNDYIAFVHQDVYLHSLGALRRAARMLADDGRIGLLGATGIADGDIVGPVRDRVLLLGEPAKEPTDVESVDEVLFMIPRRLLRQEPLSEAPELAWHAYAVEYGLRVRSRGLRVCAVDIPLTHNSLTVNLDRLDVAYRAIAASYADAMPLWTTGGLISGAPRRPRRPGWLGAHRWRYRWLKESLAAHLARRATAGGPSVLGDIRLDIDDLLDSRRTPLLVINLDRESRFDDGRRGPLTLKRGDREIMLTSEDMAGLVDTVAAWLPSTSILLTNLRLGDLRSLGSRLPRGPRLIGLRWEVGYWMLLGGAAATPEQWRSRRATPLGMPALAQ